MDNAIPMAKRRKGILLAGGEGARLWPLTRVVSKHLLAVYDKPMIYYSLSMLMLAGLRDILIISTPEAIGHYRGLLGDGSCWGMEIRYAEQSKPEGIPQAFLIGEEFLAGGPAALVLGDNMLYGDRLPEILQRTADRHSGATVFAYHVPDPERFGVAEFDEAGIVSSIEEKPAKPRSNWAVTGIYFYDHEAPAMSRTLKKSARGELEITDLNRLYLEKGCLQAVRLGRGMAWLDMGTPEAMLDASHFVQTIERRQGLKIACIEEAALNMGFISPDQFANLAARAPAGRYGDYLRGMATQLSEGRQA